MRLFQMINAFDLDQLTTAQELIGLVAEELAKGNGDICRDFSTAIDRRLKNVRDEAEAVFAKVEEKLESSPYDISFEFFDLVHDVHSRIASDMNNNMSEEDVIAWLLLQGWGERDILGCLFDDCE